MFLALSIMKRRRRGRPAMQIPIIDLFAGPGGLGEGFSTFATHASMRFDLALSIEKDATAHSTLLLRAFFRQFSRAPDDYYERLRGNLGSDELFKRFPVEHKRAADEALHLELGPTKHQTVDSLVESRLGQARSLWVLIGGPPCQAYSLVGRSRMRPGNKAKFEKDHRHFLYEEYLRIVGEFKPTMFVMENVKGLLSSSVKGEQIFHRMLEDFAGIDYSVHSLTVTDSKTALRPIDYVVKSERFGLPQKRHRVILLGLRSGVSRGGTILTLDPTKVTVANAIGDLPKIRSRISGSADSFTAWSAALSEIDLRMSEDIRESLRRTLATLKDLGTGGDFLPGAPPAGSPWLKASGLTDSRIDGVADHETRRHMPSDLRRYLFASTFARKRKASPKLADFPGLLLPDHKNAKKAVEQSLFSDRFRVQLYGAPSSTIVSHIAKDGHYYIHPDPSQCRSLTVREAARLQTFPDNYIFEGGRTAQFHQVGNAVPPMLARQIAGVVAEILSEHLAATAKAKLR